jgi:hypothetical protein
MDSNFIRSELNSLFINAESVIESLILAHETKSNIILWGPGGFGKTEIAKAFCKLAYGSEDKDIFVQSFHQGIDESKIYGGVDMLKLQNEGSIEYLTDNSFLNSHCAIFEEALDANIMALMSLKDTLTAGELRNGSQTVKSKCEFIIGCTNLKPSDIIDNSEYSNSIEAFLQRFPLQVEVNWDLEQWNVENIYKLSGAITDTMRRREFADTIIDMKDLSPRKVLIMAKLFNHSGFDGVAKSGFDVDGIKEMILERERREEAKKSIEELRSVYKELADAREGVSEKLTMQRVNKAKDALLRFQEIDSKTIIDPENETQFALYNRVKQQCQYLATAFVHSTGLTEYVEILD